MNQKSPTNSIAGSISINTTTYRQEVANFLFSCDQKLSSSSYHSSLTSWIGDTARALSLKSVAAAANDDFHHPIHGDDGTKNSGYKSVTKQADYTCLTCGTFLLPQTKLSINQLSPLSKVDEYQIPNSSLFEPSSTTNCKITLRRMKRGKSRRRRASRYRAKELHNASLLTKRVGSTNNAQVRANLMAQKERMKVVDSYRLGDGKAKHCIIVECKFCGAKRKRKGIEVSVKNTRRKTEQSDAQASRSKNKNNQQSETKQTFTKAVGSNKPQSIRSQIQDNNDFISLAPFGKSKKQAAQKRMTNPLLQAGKKKKKKQEPKSKKSNLMDFLSSLND